MDGAWGESSSDLLGHGRGAAVMVFVVANSSLQKLYRYVHMAMSRGHNEKQWTELLN
eukprot:SAG22_NODE_522_length_9503_cov_4.233624_12_plen_57_part_00